MPPFGHADTDQIAGGTLTVRHADGVRFFVGAVNGVILSLPTWACLGALVWIIL